MKNPEHVAELLAALKNECEYRFEFDAINGLQKVICTSPPSVEIIDEYHQRFCGKNYTKNNRDGHYFHGGKGEAIHRAVWKYFFGEIPKDYIIHHVDENKDNNNIENLRLMTREEHTRLHNSGVCRFPKKTFICQMCGKEYEAFDVGKNKFCSQSCTQKNYALTHPKHKTCQFCGKEFTTKHAKTKYCSSTCASRAYRASKNQNLS